MARLKQIAARTDLGYFGIGLVDSKNGYNVGGVIRAVGAFEGRFVVVSGKRWEAKGCWKNMDTEGGYLRFPCHLGVNSVLDYMPEACEPVAIELSDDAENIVDFVHPKVAMYVFGPEDGAIPAEILAKCPKKLYIPTAYSLNLYSAATVVAYDRIAKLTKAETGIRCPVCKHNHFVPITDGYHCNACGMSWTSDVK